MVTTSSVLEFLGKLVPGYDYRAKMSRLNTDRSVREKLARELRKSAVNLKEVSDLAYRDGRREVVDHIKDVLKAVDLFVVEIEDAPFGQSPLFKNDRVSDEDIDHMIEFDRQLVMQLEVVTKTSELIYDHVLKGETSDIIMQVRKLKKELDLMKNTFSDRSDYFMKR
ncbi:hypothetical protein [Methanoregula sp.]|uniref:hypothetical protein n=1 Tax=Methanoregula sp. TaxID=2052170 RepID=UPI00356AD4C6